APRHADLCSARHDRRARGRRPRRAQPPDPRDARRLRDRVRERDPRRRAADEPESVPAGGPVRGRDRRAPRPAEGALHARGRHGGTGMRRTAAAAQLGAPVVLVLGAALLGTVASQSSQTYFVDSLVKVAIVVALYVFI